MYVGIFWGSEDLAGTMSEMLSLLTIAAANVEALQAQVFKDVGGYGGYEKSCMTLSTLNLGNIGTIVYQGHAGFLNINSILPPADAIC